MKIVFASFLVMALLVSQAYAGCVDIVWNDPNCDLVNDDECFEIDDDPGAGVNLVPVRARSAHFDNLNKLNDALTYLRVAIIQFKDGSARATGVSGDAPKWLSLHRTGRGIVVREVNQITSNKSFERLYLDNGNTGGSAVQMPTSQSHAEHMRASQAAPEVFSQQNFDRANAASLFWNQNWTDEFGPFRSLCTPTANDP